MIDQKQGGTSVPDDKPSSAKAGGGAKVGGLLAGCGCLVAIGPLLLALVSPQSGAGFMLLLTAPVGFVIALMGMVVAIVTASRSKPSEAELTDVTLVVRNDEASSSVHTEADIWRARKPAPLDRHAAVTKIRRLFTTVFAVTIPISLINVINDAFLTWSPEMVVVVCLAAAFPAVVATWSFITSRKLDPDVDSIETRTNMHRLRAVQKMLAIGGGIWIPLLAIVQGFSGALTQGRIDLPGGAWFIAAGFAPMVVGVVANLVLANIMRRIRVEKPDA